MKGNNKFLLFLRKNAFYFVLGFCILAVALSVTLVLVLGKDKKPVDSGEDKPPVIEPATTMTTTSRLSKRWFSSCP